MFLFAVLVILFLIKIPSFYYFPFIFYSRLFTSHSLARILLVIVFALIVIYKFSAVNKIINQNKSLFSVLLIYLAGQSISILSATDMLLFAKDYLNIISYLLLFSSVFFLAKLNQGKFFSNIGRFIIVMSVTVIAIEGLLIVFFEQLLPVISIVVQSEIVNAFLTDFYRGRYWYVINVELFTPFLLFGTFQSARKKKWYFILLVCALFLSFFSNVRTRVLQAIFAIAASIFYLLFQEGFVRKNLAKLSGLFFIIILLIFIASNLSNSLYSFNIIDRFISLPNSSDEATIFSRVDFYHKSVELFQSSPFIGVGLGNYVNLEILKNAPVRFQGQEKYSQAYHLEVAYSPHNIFFEILSETGIVGLASFIVLIGYFLWEDIRVIKHTSNSRLVPYVISTWTIFIYTLLNPYNTIYIFGWFWFLRGVIAGMRK